MAPDPAAYSREAGYELRDASTRSVALFLLAMACLLVIIGFGVQWLFGYYERTLKSTPAVQQPFETEEPMPPPPVLQPTPAQDVQQYEESQRELLGQYGWIDRQKGIARMPIDRAMELMLKQGLPVRANGSSAPITKSSNTAANRSKRAPGEVQ